MTNTGSAMDEIMAALPAVQDSIRKDIAGRIAAGEIVAGFDGNGTLVTSCPPRGNLAERRQQLVEAHAARLAALGPMEHKSAV